MHQIKFADGVIENGTVKETNIRFLKQSDVGKCKFYILSPDHYREDGSCKCSNAQHRKFMIQNWGYKQSQFKGIPLLD